MNRKILADKVLELQGIVWHKVELHFLEMGYNVNEGRQKYKALVVEKVQEIRRDVFKNLDIRG